MPYPGSRPYANALDSSDANVDFDGDGLRLSDEYRLWVRYSADGAVRSARPGSLDDLLYSDGIQYSRDVDAPGGRQPRWPGRSTWTTAPSFATTSATPTPTAWATGTRRPAG